METKSSAAELYLILHLKIFVNMVFQKNIFAFQNICIYIFNKACFYCQLVPHCVRIWHWRICISYCIEDLHDSHVLAFNTTFWHISQRMHIFLLNKNVRYGWFNLMKCSQIWYLRFRGCDVSNIAIFMILAFQFLRWSIFNEMKVVWQKVPSKVPWPSGIHYYIWCHNYSFDCGSSIEVWGS